MSRLFISHATSDQAIIDKDLLGLLEALQFDIWYSKHSVKGSDQWQAAIREGVQNSEWFLLILSSEAARSTHVAAELLLALKCQFIKIVPICIEDCDSGRLDPRLALLQHIDWRKGDSAKNALIDVLVRGEYKPESKRNHILAISACPSKEIIAVLRWHEGSILENQALLAANHLAEQFYGFGPNMFSPGKTLLSVLQRLEQWMDPSDYSRFMEDQQRMVAALNEKRVIYAEIPMRLGLNHPYPNLRGQSFLPIAIASSHPYNHDGRRAIDVLLIYLNLSHVQSPVNWTARGVYHESVGNASGTSMAVKVAPKDEAV